MLEARDRRLRRQAAAVNRIASQQQLVDRILGESVAVIAVGMAARDREDPLGDQLPDAVRDPPWIANAVPPRGTSGEATTRTPTPYEA